MKTYILFFIIFLSSCFSGGKNIDVDNPDEPTVSDCVFNGSYSEDDANIKVSWNESSKTCVNSCGGGYKIYYKKRNVEADDNFLKDLMELPTNINVFDVPYSSQNNTVPNSAELNLSSGKWYVKISSYCNNIESDPSNAFVLEVE